MLNIAFLSEVIEDQLYRLKNKDTGILRNVDFKRRNHSRGTPRRYSKEKRIYNQYYSRLEMAVGMNFDLMNYH